MIDPSDATELRRRAAALAVPPPPPAPADEVDVLAFSVGAERYLLPAAVVARTLPITRVQRLPGARLPLLGACSAGGRLLPLADLPTLLGAAGPPSTAAAVAIVVDDGDRPSLALAADRVERLLPLRPGALLPDPSSSALVRGTTADGAALLDHEALLDHPDLLPTDRSSR